MYFADRHLVLRQRAGLIGTDDRCTTQGFHRWKTPDDGIVPCHSPNPDGQTARHNGGQCLRNGGNGEAHRPHKHCQEAGTPQEYLENENDCDNGKAQNSEPLSDAIQPLFERRFLLLDLLNQSRDSSEFGLRAGGRYDPFSSSVAHHGGREDHAGPVSHSQFPLLDGIRPFFDWDRLSCEGGFICSQIGGFDHPGIRGNPVPRRQQNDITGDDLPRGHLLFPSIPDHLGPCGGHLF